MAITNVTAGTQATAAHQNGLIAQCNASAATLAAFALKMYAATVADVSNTSSITTTVSWTNTGAVADGDEIEVRGLVLIKNDKGTSGTVTLTFGFGGVTGATSSVSWADNSTERVYMFRFRFVRYGSDMYVQNAEIGDGKNPHRTDANTVDNLVTLSAPTFTAGQTGLIRVTLSAADTTFYWKTKSARVQHYGAV